MALPPYWPKLSKIRLVTEALGPSSKVSAIIGLDGSIVDGAVSAGAPAFFAVIDALMPSTLSPAPSVPAVAPFTAQSVQEPFW